MRNPEGIYRMLLKASLAACSLFFVVPVGYAFMMMNVGVGPNADAVEIYVRNISSIVALFITGAFFYCFWIDHISSYTYTGTKPMNFSKLITLSMGVAAVIKVLISIYYLIRCIADGNIVMLFYVGEILVWSALAFFAFTYYRRMNFKHN